MPTGYTAEIYEGKKEVAFKDFIMQCARAFGALVMMRDDPNDAPIPEKFEPSDYSVKQLAGAKDELVRVFAWTTADADAAATTAFTKDSAAWNTRKIERETRRQRYEAMLVQVRAWSPPSSDHEGLKEFMEKQLLESIDFDCSGTYDKTPIQVGGTEYRLKRIAALHHDIEYWSKSHAEEEARVAERNRWVRQLRESIEATDGEK